jgi:hypothetical protein
MIARMVRDNRFITAKEIIESLGLSGVSEDTICNRIHELCGFRSFYSVNKPFVSESNRKVRLAGVCQKVR